MDKCIFCAIIAGDIPSDKVYETENILAFRDINPQAPNHVVLIPKNHVANILEVDPGSAIMNQLLEAVQEIAKLEGMEENGFRLVNNCKSHGGQTVDHLHFHILGGRNLQWPPG